MFISFILKVGDKKTIQIMPTKRQKIPKKRSEDFNFLILSSRLTSLNL